MCLVGDAWTISFINKIQLKCWILLNEFFIIIGQCECHTIESKLSCKVLWEVSQNFLHNFGESFHIEDRTRSTHQRLNAVPKDLCMLEPTEQGTNTGQARCRRKRKLDDSVPTHSIETNKWHTNGAMVDRRDLCWPVCDWVWNSARWTEWIDRWWLRLVQLFAANLCKCNQQVVSDIVLATALLMAIQGVCELWNRRKQFSDCHCPSQHKIVDLVFRNNPEEYIDGMKVKKSICQKKKTTISTNKKITKLEYLPFALHDAHSNICFKT